MKDFVQEANAKTRFLFLKPAFERLPWRLERIFLGQLNADSPDAAFVGAVTWATEFHLEAVETVSDQINLVSMIRIIKYVELLLRDDFLSVS